MKLKISHETQYNYSETVPYLLQQIRLTPRKDAAQKLLEWETRIEGANKEASFYDQFNNHVILCSNEKGVDAISIVSEGLVEVENTAGIVKERGMFAPLWLYRKATDLTQIGEGVRELIKPFSLKDGQEVAMLHDLSAATREKIEYEVGTTNSITTAEDAIALSKGVCQDHAHVFISCARELGMPARYVSGYLMMNDRIDQDASHAWSEIHINGIGWVGFDVSNGISPDDRYVRLATGLDYSDAAPISGMRLGNSAETMNVSIQVQQ